MRPVTIGEIPEEQVAEETSHLDTLIHHEHREIGVHVLFNMYMACTMTFNVYKVY